MNTKIKPRIIQNHDYVSLVLNKRRLTVSWSRTKASCGIPSYVFDLWTDVMVHRKPEALQKIGLLTDTSNLKNLEFIQAFADKIDVIWPDWAVEKQMPKVGDIVKANFGKRAGIHSGKVVAVTKSYVYADWEGMGKTGVHFDMLVV